MRKKYLYLLSIIGAIISFDQLTKHLIEANVKLGETISAIEGFFNITYVRNSGAAFGLFAGTPENFRVPFFLIIPIVALIFLIYIFRKVEERNYLMTMALGCIAGGAIGNFIDRIRFGYVIDFLEFFLGRYRWPSFNLADMFICIGVFLFAIYTLFFEKRQKKV